MRPSWIVLCLVFAAAWTSLACSPRAYTAHLASQQVKITAPMVAKPIARKLLVVIDPSKVPNDLKVENSPHSVTGFGSFLGEAIRGALAPYFAEVVIVAPGFTPPTAPHVVADVKVDNLARHSLPTGRLTYDSLRLQWALAIRPSEAEEYLFSFAGVGESERSYATLDEGCNQMVKAALHGFLEKWSEEDIFAALRKLDEAPAEAEPAEQPDETGGS